jgi:hypothetical protein
LLFAGLIRVCVDIILFFTIEARRHREIQRV